MEYLRNFMFSDTGRCRADTTARRTAAQYKGVTAGRSAANESRYLYGETVKIERSNDGKMTAKESENGRG
ncbi:hypothetical protein ACMV5I_29155 [Serratia sp. T13T92]|uniref:hypothetical protein n=1 Tax=Serratia sp. T13T92 TaxID=3397496 RepID=UPI0039DF81CF